MKRSWKPAIAACGTLALLGTLLGGHLAVSRTAKADQKPTPEILTPTGKTITPTAASGAIFQDLNPADTAAPDQRANHAAAVATSPDGSSLAVLTNRMKLQNGPDGKFDWKASTKSEVFLFDITGREPKQLQVLSLGDSFRGLAWAPSSRALFVSAGMDDAVFEFTKSDSTFTEGRKFALGHHFGVGLKPNAINDPLWGDLGTGALAGDLAVSPDGTRLLVTNFQNDSVSLIDLKSGQVTAEQDLRPGMIDPKHHGEPGGSYPRCVAWTSPSHAYVGSERDREIISLKIAENKMQVVRRIPTQGQPVAMLANHKGSRLYIALDNTDQVAILDTSHDTLIETFSVVAPDPVYPNTKKLAGANPNALALTPDEGTLLVSNGGENAVAVVRLDDVARASVHNVAKKPSREDDNDHTLQTGRSAVVGLVPTGWYPTGVATSRDATTWYITNGKSPAGPNAQWCQEVDPERKVCTSKRSLGPDFAIAENGFGTLIVENQFIYQLEKAGFLTMPVPAPLELARLTKQVAHNNRFDRPDKSADDEHLFSFLRDHIHHVIYVIKENRTYDQILGDLEIGNGDPRLTIFPEKIAPNHHAIARGFVTLDNFLLSGEGSWDGWEWETAARINDLRESQRLANGLAGVQWGADRNINVGLATSAERQVEFPLSPADADVLPGARDIAALDGPGGEEGKGYLWDAALRHGLTVRNYGFFEAPRSTTPLVHDPAAQALPLFFPTIPSLIPLSDVYYRGWDPAYPDFWRYREWKREFDSFVSAGKAPNLMLVQLGNDHLGSFNRAIDDVNTPEAQMADNDYALGLMIEAVANSPFAKDTVIIAIEDDPCDGPDHVDAFRSVTLFAGPYVRQHSVVSAPYNTVRLVKTIEEILGIGPIGLNDALAAPMSEVFDTSAASWSYKAIVPDVLYSTKLPLPQGLHANNIAPQHSAAYWAKAMAGQDFTGPDRIDPIRFNRALWRGLKGDEPYPTSRTHTDLHEGRGLMAGVSKPNAAGAR